MLLEKLTSGEVTEEVFDSIKTKNNFTIVATPCDDFAVKLVRRHYSACNMEVVVANLNEKNGKGSSSGEDSVDESEEKAVQESVEGGCTTRFWRYVYFSMWLFLIIPHRLAALNERKEFETWTFNI